MAVAFEQLASLLHARFGAGNVVLEDLAGDGDHYRVSIVSPEFAGISRPLQHRMVYDALGDLMQSQLHALSIVTTPAPTA